MARLALSALVVLALGCATARPVPRGLATDALVVETAERHQRDAAKVRSIAGAIAAVAAGAGVLLLAGTQLAPAPLPVDASLGTAPVQSQLIRDRLTENRARDGTIGVGVVVGSLGFFLGACVVSAVIDGEASEWLVEQRALEVQQLSVPEAEANQRLFEAAKDAQRLAGPPGTTFKPGGPKRKRDRVPKLSPLPSG